MKQQVTLIAVVARNGAIGVRGDQPFHISEDFKRFKALTMGKPIIMGRRTFEALPKGALPGRRNIVVSRNSDYQPAGVEVVASIEDALRLVHDAPEVMVIGGGQIYGQSMPLANRLELTVVDADVVDADTFFPHVDEALWHKERESECFTDPRSGADYQFVSFVRL